MLLETRCLWVVAMHDSARVFLVAALWICSSLWVFPVELQGPPPPGPTPPAPTQPNPSARTWFGPDFDPDFDRIRTWKGRFQVEIRSKPGPNQLWAEGFSWVGAGGVGPDGRGPVAPRNVSTVVSGFMRHFQHENAVNSNTPRLALHEHAVHSRVLNCDCMKRCTLQCFWGPRAWNAVNSMIFELRLHEDASNSASRHFSAWTCYELQGQRTFLQKYDFRGHMLFPAEKCGFRGAHGKKPQAIAGGFQDSRIKNARQLSQDQFPCVFEMRLHDYVRFVGLGLQKPWPSTE